MESFLQQLNEKQMAAVTTESQYCRVIAGAGSGKTRVLTNRFIYLLKEKDVSPFRILAITFTNKASKEIKDRIIKFMPDIDGHLQVFTFHSFCLKFLRRESMYLNLPRDFIILDDEDQSLVLRRILKEEGYNAKSQMAKEMQGYISYQKNLGNYPDDVVIKSFNPQEKEKLRLYKLYQDELDRNMQLDFDDLLLKTLLILEEFKEVRDKWKTHFKHILIDEFQDTNDIQYRIIKNVMGLDTALYVVGDPDQTIYTWRGANQTILLNMKKEYPNIETIILDESYRSTKKILNVANALIKHNKGRIEKNLFTENQDETGVVYNDFYDAFTEARFVVSQIMNLQSYEKYRLKDMVIMYRANYLTLPFEKMLVQNKIPYVIYGGQKFYQRKEVKDILAFLRLMVNKSDNVSFERIVNIPKRGIGDTSLERLHSEANYLGISYYDYALNIENYDSNIPSKARGALKEVSLFLDKLKENLEKSSIDEFLKYLLDETHYQQFLIDTEENAAERYENVETLISDLVSTLKSNSDLTLAEYLENIALMSAQDYIEDKDCLTLMTVHTAKGLEFPVVFLTGLTEGVFPSGRALEEDPEKNLEEERRICYVAFTRAMRRLYVSSFRVGFKGQISSPSCFIKEAGLKDIERQEKEEKRYNSPYGQIKRPQVMTKPFVSNPSVSAQKVNWKIGDRLRHITFGYGKVIGVEESTISVRFDDGSIKKLLGAHASLTKIEGDENNEA